MSNKLILNKVQKLLDIYLSGKLGDTTMPEDTHPLLNTQEEKLLYYTLPMALNYQRNSYKLWEAAKQTWEDKETKQIFNFEFCSKSNEDVIRDYLSKYKLALQPNKHINTWKRISESVYKNWGSLSELLKQSNFDYLNLRDIVQKKYKKQFPYLSGPKIFNYWTYILTKYCDVELKNRNHIEIAPDTHVLQASVKLGIITKEDINKISKEEVSRIWRELLDGTNIDPIDVHSPLWFWSRGGFRVELISKTLNNENLILEEFKKALKKSWSKDTAHESVKKQWDTKNKELGQCAVTSLLVNKYFAGEIWKGDIVGKKYSHFWNVLPNGEKIDLTKSQLKKENIKIVNIKVKTTKELLENKDLKIRYELLKKRVEKYLKK